MLSGVMQAVQAAEARAKLSADNSAKEAIEAAKKRFGSA